MGDKSLSGADIFLQRDLLYGYFIIFLLSLYSFFFILLNFISVLFTVVVVLPLQYATIVLL